MRAGFYDIKNDISFNKTKKIYYRNNLTDLKYHLKLFDLNPFEKEKEIKMHDGIFKLAL